MKRPHKIALYRSYGYWYWRLSAPNGRIIADGAEAYSSRTAVCAAVGRFIRAYDTPFKINWAKGSEK